MTEAPPEFLALAGHAVRWRMLRELARSDRTVRELTELAGERQSLVSYHLRLMRQAGVVRARRSSADGRDTYYALDLTTCRELLTAAGAGLHPALRWAPVPEPEVRREAGVLFVCSGNSARSPMAQGILAAKGMTAVSAGSHPKPLDTRAVREMRRRGIDIASHRPTGLDEVAGRRFRHVISLCDRVRSRVPALPGEPAVAHWSIPDPAEGADLREVADELTERIGALMFTIDEEA